MPALADITSCLDQEFAIAAINDNWSYNFDDVFLKRAEKGFLVPNKNTGLVFKGGNQVVAIYTAFAPSRYVLETIKQRGIKNSLLVVKHPFDWNGSKTGLGFISFREEDYKLFDEMQISLYSLHTPWDKNRNDTFVSTAYGLAKKLGFVPEGEFANDPANPGLKLGLYGTLPVNTFDDTVELIASRLDYKPHAIHKLTRSERVAIVTGGGFIPSLIQEAKDLGCDTYITGIITANASTWSQERHGPTLLKVNQIDINVIGASHYLTEKFACEYSVPFFEQFGVPVRFIEDEDARLCLE